MCIYNSTGTRKRLINELTSTREYLDKDETELCALTDSALEKLRDMSDDDFAGLPLYPDFAE